MLWLSLTNFKRTSLERFIGSLLVALVCFFEWCCVDFLVLILFGIFSKTQDWDKWSMEIWDHSIFNIVVMAALQKCVLS